MASTHGYEPNDPRGLICAFRLAPFAACGPEILDEGGSRAPIWLHFNVADLRARHWLETRAELPESALNVLLGAHPEIRVVKMAKGLLLVLRD
jgi:zinc transporter